MEEPEKTSEEWAEEVESLKEKIEKLEDEINDCNSGSIEDYGDDDLIEYLQYRGKWPGEISTFLDIQNLSIPDQQKLELLRDHWHNFSVEDLEKFLGIKSVIINK